MEPAVVVQPMAVRWDTAGRMLDCSDKKVRQLEKAGLLSTIRIGADRRVTVESIQKFIANGGER